VDHANPAALATEAAEDEISPASETGLGAVGILTTEAFDGRHEGLSQNRPPPGVDGGQFPSERVQSWAS
jgi:hypothetical protein